MDETRYTLFELEDATGVPARTIRYYIQRELVDRPEGEKRGAYYTATHVEQLLRIRRWSEEGLSLERIARLLSAKDTPPVLTPEPGTIAVRTHVHLRPGLELVISPDEIGLDQAELRQLIRSILDATDRAVGARPKRKE
jgi:DNA-binding transcriptional MerR regulator